MASLQGALSFPGRHKIRFVRFCAAAILLVALAAAWQPVLVSAQSAQKESRPGAAKDGPVSVTYHQLFKEGKITFDDLDPAKVAPLPKGYAAYNNAGYKIVTEAIAVGPHVVEFNFHSVADRAVFDSLRILHAEWDKVDERFFWVDSTIEESEEHARDFNKRTVSASAEHLGAFAVARLVEKPKPYTAEADLGVEIVAPRERIGGNTDAHFEIKLTNRGPSDATYIILHGTGFSSDQFVSATGPTQGNGRCKQDGSNFDCKLDRLEKGATAVFRVVLNPRENPRLRLPEEGQNFDLWAYATSPEEDKNFDDNEARSDILVYPDPNRAPVVEWAAPAEGGLFVAPAEIKLSARASDPDSGLAKVQFYDSETLIGEGVPAGKDEFKIGWSGARPGIHLLTVIATDSGGRSAYDNRVVRINGPLTVRASGPQPGAVFKSKIIVKGEHEIGIEPVDVEATASIGPKGAKIKEVAFVVSYDLPGMGKKELARAVGVDAATGETRYAITLKGLGPAIYTMTVVATDREGVETVSPPTRFRVTAAPAVRLSVEQRDSDLKSPADVAIRAQLTTVAHHNDPSMKGVRVDFYAGGKLIGSAMADSFVGLARFVWRDAPPGAHDVTAITTNADGAISDPSAPLRVNVQK